MMKQSQFLYSKLGSDLTQNSTFEIADGQQNNDTYMLQFYCSDLNGR